MGVISSYVVLTMVNSFGRNGTLTLKSSGTYNSETQTYSTGSDDTRTVKMYTAEYKAAELDGNTIVMGDQKTLVPAYDTSGVAIKDIRIGDSIDIDGATYRVMNTQKIYEGSNVACYVCQTRK